MSLTTFLQKLLRQLFDTKPHYQLARIDDMPDVVEDRVLYLIGESNSPWVASFVCPCGCKEIISLSLIKTDTPRWQVRVSREGDVTLTPSVWRTKGCRSHFFVRRSRVIWVRDVEHRDKGRR